MTAVRATSLGEALAEHGVTGWVVAKAGTADDPHPLWWQGPARDWGTTYDAGTPTRSTAWWPTRAAAEQAVRGVYGARWRRQGYAAVKVIEELVQDLLEEKP